MLSSYRITIFSSYKTSFIPFPIHPHCTYLYEVLYYKPGLNPIDNIVLNKTWGNYEEAALDAIGYVYVPDKNYSQEHFIEPLAQTQREDRQDDYRYFYDAASFETGQVVTAIGIQDGQTLKAVSGITDNLMENALDRETAIKQGGAPSAGTHIFSIVFSILLLFGGAVLLIKQ